MLAACSMRKAIIRIVERTFCRAYSGRAKNFPGRVRKAYSFANAIKLALPSALASLAESLSKRGIFAATMHAAPKKPVAAIPRAMRLTMLKTATRLRLSAKQEGQILNFKTGKPFNLDVFSKLRNHTLDEIARRQGRVANIGLA